MLTHPENVCMMFDVLQVKIKPFIVYLRFTDFIVILSQTNLTDCKDIKYMLTGKHMQIESQFYC